MGTHREPLTRRSHNPSSRGPFVPSALACLIRPLLTPAARQDRSLDPQSRMRDKRQVSRGKLDRLQRATAGFTTSALDGYGLRSHSPARPAVCLLSGSCPSARAFAPRFFQTSPHGDALALRYDFTSIRLSKGLSPSSCRTCSAHTKMAGSSNDGPP